MKKLVALTIVVALFIGIPFCAFAQEQRKDAAAKLCKDPTAGMPYVDLSKNVGECVSYMQTCMESGHSPEWCHCVRIRVYDIAGYENFFKTQALGQCLDYYRHHPSYY
jgi:hypothetical protein